MQKELVLTIGPIGAGKSTYCRSALAEYFYINQDKQGRKGHWELFLAALQEQRRVVVDRMGFNKEQRRRYTLPARQDGFSIKYLWFKHVSYETCLTRVINRERHETIPKDARSLALQVLNDYFTNFEPPARSEYDNLVIL